MKNNIKYRYTTFMIPLLLLGCNSHDISKEYSETQSYTEFASPATMSSGAMPMMAYAQPSQHQENIPQNKFLSITPNGVIETKTTPVSTFSIDVDTAAYSYIRRKLSSGDMPSHDVVRIEEMINYFSYDYPKVETDIPFSVHTEVAKTPWNKNTLLMKVALNAKQDNVEKRPDANLVFLIDVSGSMQGEDKLDLIKKGLDAVVKKLTKNDRVSIVVYAGRTELLLDGVAGHKHANISNIIDRLGAGGSTNGGAGIKLAYRAAGDNYIENGINRVIIASDGDFNVGTVNHQSLIDLVKREAESGVELTVLGVGEGNLNDATMEQLADQGNGNYAYLDTVKEAYRVLGKNMLSTIFTVARDVKIQVEFNPEQVAEYRLIGYENRLLAQEDFNNDHADAGELGAGQDITALYEITLTDSQFKFMEALRYTKPKPLTKNSNELAYVKVRYKPLNSVVSRLTKHVVAKSDVLSKDKVSSNFKFAAAVASFGQRLRLSKYNNGFSYDDILSLINKEQYKDVERALFVDMVTMAKTIEGI